MNEPNTNQETELNSSAKAARPYTLGVIGLLLGLAAMALAIIPAVALDRPLPNPFASRADVPAPPPAGTEPTGGLTLKYKSFTFNLGSSNDEPQIEIPKPEPAVTLDPVRWFTIAAVVSALIGVVFSAIGQIKEQHTSLTVSSMSCCVAAMTWQYFAAGIMIGAAIAIFIILMAILISAAA